MSEDLTGVPALTLHNPWPAAIAHADKRVENRGWPPPARLTGRRLIIHAGRAVDPAGMYRLKLWTPTTLTQIVPSAVVAVVTVANYCYPTCPGTCSRWAAAGQYHWHLTDVTALTAPVVDVRGRQSLWYPAPELRDRIAAATP